MQLEPYTGNVNTQVDVIDPYEYDRSNMKINTL